MTHNDKRRVVKLVSRINIDAVGYGFLAVLQVSATTGLQKVLELPGRIKGMVISEHTSSYQIIVLLELVF